MPKGGIAMVLVGGEGHCRCCGKRNLSAYSCEPGPMQVAQIAIEEVENLVSEIHLNEIDRKRFNRWCEEIRQILGIPQQPLCSFGMIYVPPLSAIPRARELQDYMKRLIEEYGYMRKGQFVMFREALEKMGKVLGL